MKWGLAASVSRRVTANSPDMRAAVSGAYNVLPLRSILSVRNPAERVNCSRTSFGGRREVLPEAKKSDRIGAVTLGANGLPIGYRDSVAEAEAAGTCC